MISNSLKIRKMVEFLEKNCEYDAVFCLSQYIDVDEHVAFQIQDGYRILFVKSWNKGFRMFFRFLIICCTGKRIYWEAWRITCSVGKHI